jgi:hypothetical protein
MKKFTTKLFTLLLAGLAFTAAPVTTFAKESEAGGILKWFNKFFGKDADATEEYTVTANDMTFTIGKNGQLVKNPLVITELEFGTIQNDTITLDFSAVPNFNITKAVASVESTNLKIDKITVKDNVITIHILPPTQQMAMQAPTVVTLNEIIANVGSKAEAGTYPVKLTISRASEVADEAPTVLFEQELATFVTLSN